MSPGFPSVAGAGILITPMGAVELPILLGLQRELEEALATEVRAGETMELPRDAYDPKRRQYRATVLLAALAPAGDERVLGVADVDLYVRGLNFVFGLADALSRRAVIALPRLRTAPGAHAGAEVLFLERATKEAAHEFGAYLRPKPLLRPSVCHGVF